MSLTGKVVVITGGARGMGREYVRWFLREGCKVVALDQSWEGVDDFSDELKGFEEALVLTGNIISDADLDAAYQATMDRFGAVDVLLNNASMRMRDVHPSAVLNILDSTDEQWQYAFEASVLGLVKAIRRFVRPMIENKSGSISNVYCGSGIVGRPGNQPYGAVKAALHNFTQSLSGELAEYNIAVNSLIPGGTRSTGYEEQTRLQAEMGRVRVRNPVRPDHTAPAAVWLAQQDSSTFTGEAVDALTWNEENGYGAYDAWASPD